MAIGNPFARKKQQEQPEVAAEQAGKAEESAPKKRGLSEKLSGVLKRDKKEQALGGSVTIPAANSANKKKSSNKISSVRKRTCFVLMVGDDGGILTYLQKGRVARRIYAPSAEAQHLKPVMEVLNAHPEVPIYVLCDMADQSYVRHSLPPVSSFSINKLVQRRLNRDFAPEDIKGSIAMGREKDGRKEWNYLLISLANSSVLQQWLDPLLQAPNRFLGLYLSPVEMQGFVASLAQASGAVSSGLDSEWKIIVAHDKVSGFRQVVLHHGKLVFTRLTSLPGDTSVEVVAGNVEQEVQNTIEYLRRMSFNDDAGLDVYIILAQPVRDLIETHKMGATQVKAFSPYDVAKLLELEQAALSGDRFADVVLSANFALRQKPQLKMATQYAKKLDQLYTAKLGVKALGVLLVLAIVAQSCMAAYGWWQAESTQGDVSRRLRSAKIELTDVERRYESLGADQEKVMQVSALYRAIDSIDQSPLDFVSQLAQMRQSGIRLITWSWGLVQEEKNGKKSKSSSKKKSAKAQYQIAATIEFLEHNGDSRELSRQVKAFTEALRASFSGYEVTRSMLPEEKKAAEGEQSVVLDLNAPQPEESYEVQPGDELIRYDFVSDGEKKKAGGK